MPVCSDLEGLWSAELTGDREAAGIGILVFEPLRVLQGGYEEGRVLGGDRHYVHRGTYRVEDRHVSGELRILRYDVHEDSPPLFAQDETSLEFRGMLDPGRHGEVLDLELIGAERAVPGATGLRLTLRVAS